MAGGASLPSGRQGKWRTPQGAQQGLKGNSSGSAEPAAGGCGWVAGSWPRFGGKMCLQSSAALLTGGSKLGSALDSFWGEKSGIQTK